MRIQYWITAALAAALTTATTALPAGAATAGAAGGATAGRGSRLGGTSPAGTPGLITVTASVVATCSGESYTTTFVASH